MPEVKDLIKDFYAKYDKGAYSEEKAAEVEDYYKGDISSLAKDFYAKYDKDAYSEEKVSSIVDYYSSKKKDQEEVSSEELPQEETPQMEVQEDMESVSEDGSSASQDWRGEQKKPVRSALTVEQEDFKTLEDKGALEQPEQKDVLDFKKDPITIKEVEEGNEEFIRKRDAETGVPKALGEEYDYLSSTTEDILDNLPSEIDDNYAFQFIEQKKNDLLNKQGKEYFNNMLSDSSKAYLDRGDASAMEEAEDFVKRDYLKSMRNMGINSLGLDSDKIDEAKPKLDEYYRLRQIPWGKRTPEQNAKVYELKDYVSKFREDSEKFFIDPKTGKIDGEKRKLVNDLEAKYVKEAKTDFQKFSSRYKQEYDNINAIDNSMVDAYFGDKSELEFRGEFGLFGNISKDDIFKMTKEGTLPSNSTGKMTNANIARLAPGYEYNNIPEENAKKVISLLEEKEKSELNFNALSRALLLNENPSAVAKGWGEFFNAEDSEFNIPFLDKIGEGITSFGESFVEAIPGVGNVGTDRDFKKDIVRIANEEGVTLTEEQYDSAVDNMTEQIGGLFGTSGEIMAEIIVTTLLTKNASSAVNLAGKVGKLVNSLGGGKKAANIAGEGLAALEQAIAFDLTSQGSAAMGMGEFLGAKGADKILNILSKGKSAKFMKFIKPLTRIMGATTVGQVEEYGGEYLVQGFKNGFLSKETFRNTFGRNYDEAKDKFLMTLILTGTFGTGAEVANMYKLGKDYYKDSGDQTQLNDVEKAFNEIQNTKKEKVLTKFDDMSEAELKKYAEDNNVDISELKKTIEAAKKPEVQRLDDMSQEELEAYAEENNVDISELKKEETTEVEPSDITAKPEDVVEEEDKTTEEAVSEEESILSEDLEALEDEVSDALGDTFKDNIGETVTYNGEVGVLKQEGQSLVVENNNKIQVLGNIDELSNKPISSMKVKQGGELEAETADVTKDVPSDLITEIDGVPHRIVNARTRKGEPYVTVKNLETGIQNKISGEEGKPLLDQFKSYKGRKSGEAKAEAKARTEEEYNALSQKQKDKEQKDFDALVEKEVKAEQELESKMKEEESLESNLKKEEEAITKEAEELKDLGEQELEEEVKKLRKKALVISNKQGDFLVKKKPDGSYSVSKKNQETGRYVPFTGKSNVKKRAELVDQFKKEISKAESKKIDEAAELSESIEKDKRDAIEKALDKVIEATSMKGNNAYNNILGVPINIAHGALKIVKASYKVSRDLSKAVQQGINSMTSNGYNVNEVEFKKFVINEIKAGNKKIEIAKKQKEKENKKNEQNKKREERKKTLKDESKSEKIKREAEESRKRDADLEASLNSLIEDALGTKKPVTKRDVTKIQKRFKDFISANKQILREASPALNATIANKIASVSSPATLKSTAEYISKITKDTKFKKEQESRVKLIEDIKKELQDKSFSRKGSAPRQGKIASEIQDFLKKVRQKLDYTQEIASKERGVILNSISDIDDMTIDKKRMLLALSFADIENKSKEELDNLTQLLKEYKKEGRELLSERKKARSKKYQEGIDDLLTAILAGEKLADSNAFKSSTKSAKGVAIASFSNIKKLYDRAISKTENWSGILNLINRLGGKDVGGNQKAKDFLKDKFLTPVQKARSKKTKDSNAVWDSIEEKKKSIFGKNLKDINKDLQKNIFIRDSNGKKIETPGKEGSGEYLSITKDMAMYIYNLQKDPSLEATLDEMNKTDSKILIDEANKIMSENPELKEYADWVHNDFYPNYYSRINEEYRKHYDYDLPFNENYSPIRRQDVAEEDIDMLSPTKNIASTLNGSLIERVKNTKALDLTLGMDGTMLGYMDSMEHFIAYTDVVKFLNKTFGDSKVKKAIEQKLGKVTNNVIENFIKDLAGEPASTRAQIKILDKLRQRYTTSVLGLNPGVFIKQLTSAPAYAVAEGVNTADYVKQSTMMLTTKEGIQDLIDISKSVYVKDRLKRTGFDRDTALNYKQDFDKLVSGGQALRNKLMFLTKYGDIGAIVIGGTPYYTSMKKKYIKQGMSRAEAMEKAMFDFENATEATQQSSSTSELSDLQRGSSIMKALTMFKTSPAQYFRKGFSTPLRNLTRGRGTVQDIKNIAMFQVILPSLFTFATKGLMSDEEDIPDYIKSIALGNFTGIPILGDLVKLGMDSFDGTNFSSNNIPAMQGVQKLTEAVSEAMADGDIPFDELIESVITPALEIRTGLPIKNAKKLTYDNLKRIGKGNFNQEKLMKYLAYGDYSLGIDKKKKTKSEKRREAREEKSESRGRKKSKSIEKRRNNR